MRQAKRVSAADAHVAGREARRRSFRGMTDTDIHLLLQDAVSRVTYRVGRPSADLLRHPAWQVPVETAGEGHSAAR